MGKEWTLAMLKPDAVERNLIGAIISRLESEGFRVVAIKMTRLTKESAEAFYSVHRGKPFFESLVRYITSGPVVAIVLEREDAVTHLRSVMGATDPAKADRNTIRFQYGLSIEKNTIHGSDSPENARREIAFFFTEQELAELTSK